MNQYPEQGRDTVRNRLHCPHCRSEHLIAVNEATQTGGVASTSRITRNTGLTTYSANTITRYYWMCRDCGHKFRNLEDLDKELVKETKNIKAYKILAIALGVIALLLTLVVISNTVLLLIFGIPVLVIDTFACILFALWHTTKKNVEQMTKDKAFLEQHCFD